MNRQTTQNLPRRTGSCLVREAIAVPPERQLRQTASRLLTTEDLCSLLQISRSSVERSIRSDPDFPQPRVLPRGRLIRFLETEVLGYIANLPRAKYADHAFDPDDVLETE